MYGASRTDNEAAIGFYLLRTQAYSESPFLPPIPEPETCATLLAGLGVIGYMRQCRRS